MATSPGERAGERIVTARALGEVAERLGIEPEYNFTHMKHTHIKVDRSWQRDTRSSAGAERNAGHTTSSAQPAAVHVAWTKTAPGLGGRAVAFLVGFLLMTFGAQAQEITGMWHVKGLATVAEAVPAEITTTDWNGMMTIASLGGGDYRLTFSGEQSAVLELSFTQDGDFFGYGDEFPHEEDEQLLVHQRTGIYVVNATTLLFQHAEAVMRPSEGSEGTLFNFESHRAVLTRAPLPAANPGGWTGTYESVRGISLGVSNGAGFDEDYLTEVNEYVGLATAGGYRFLGGDSEDGSFNTTLFVAVGDRELGRSATSSGGVLYQDDEWQIDRVLEKHDGRAIQMGNGDLVYFGGDGAVGAFRSKNPDSGSVPFNLLNGAETEVAYMLRQGDAVTLLTSPESLLVAAGDSATFSVTLSEVPGATPTYQWYFNNRPIDGATSRDLTLDDVQPADAGAYHLRLTAGGRVSDSESATLGLASTVKAAGEAYEFDDDIVHPNGNKYDQVLLTGAAATVTADAGEVTRTSFVDLNDDIVQIEFSGAGTLAISLAADALPANPVKYNQSVDYMKGHATITITGADETSNVSIFTVGRMTAFDPTGGYDMTKPIDDTNKPANNGSPLFNMGESYDGVADVALITISSPTGRFGGVRAANARFYAVAGHTGLFAPAVRFAGPVYLHELNARDDATPVLVTGELEQTGEIRITGGNLEQSNARAVRIGSAAKVVMAAGITSHAVELPAQANAGRIERNEADVTDSVVIETD